MQTSGNMSYSCWDFIQEKEVIGEPHTTAEEQAYCYEVAAAYLRATFTPLPEQPSNQIQVLQHSAFCTLARLDVDKRRNRGVYCKGLQKSKRKFWRRRTETYPREGAATRGAQPFLRILSSQIVLLDQQPCFLTSRPCATCKGLFAVCCRHVLTQCRFFMISIMLFS